MPETEKKDPKKLRADLDSKADQMWKNLTEDVNPTFALANYLTQKKYGDQDRQVFDEFVYRPALGTSKGGKFLADALIESRQEEQIGSGGLVERVINQRGQKITEASLIGIKVGKLYDLIGLDQEQRSALKLDSSKYLAEYLEFGSDVEKARAEQVVVSYFEYKVDGELSEAYKKAQKAVGKNLKEGAGSDRFAKIETLKADTDKYKAKRTQELGLAA